MYQKRSILWRHTKELKKGGVEITDFMRVLTLFDEANIEGLDEKLYLFFTPIIEAINDTDKRVATTIQRGYCVCFYLRCGTPFFDSIHTNCEINEGWFHLWFGSLFYAKNVTDVNKRLMWAQLIAVVGLDNISRIGMQKMNSDRELIKVQKMKTLTWIRSIEHQYFKRGGKRLEVYPNLKPKENIEGKENIIKERKKKKGEILRKIL